MFILVVDDDPKITALLKRTLAFEKYTVKTANNGADGLAIAIADKPDLVVLDIMMPGTNGWEVCRSLRSKSDVPILMLTARDDVGDRVKGLDLGADDYLVKPFALEEFLARVRALLRRRQQIENQSRVLSYADLSLDTGTREAIRGGRFIVLTAKEYELLKLFLENPRQVLTRDILMEKVWGFDFSGESNVLEVYIGMLRQKLEEGGASRLIKTVRGVGYVLRDSR